jgi:hypothetical protein
MAATTLQLYASDSKQQRLLCSADGFLLGPKGEVWSLDPSADSKPQLRATAPEGAKVPTVDFEEVPWLLFKMPHSSRYLRVQAVTDRLEPGIKQSEVGGGCFYLLARDQLPSLIDARNVNGPADVTLHNAHWVGGARTPYLLLASRSADAKALLAYAREHELPQPAPGAAAPWEISVELGPRGRLSALAATAERWANREVMPVSLA